ncbi:MAG: hypothetical protein SGBAC_011704 [Bacillariaceae sp.]
MGSGEVIERLVSGQSLEQVSEALHFDANIVAPRDLQIIDEQETAIGNSLDDDFEAASGCILVCDDNHFLIEWIAYHYHVINLRTLIVTSDPNSRTSPQPILDRWKGLIDIEYWNESRFMDPDDITWLERAKKLQMHRLRQRSFNKECLRELKRRDKGWTILTDTDEFVTLNPKLNDTAYESLYTPNLTSIREPGSVIEYLKDISIPNENISAFTPCIPIHRWQFSSRESTLEEVEKDVPSNFHGSEFLTLRWRRFGANMKYFQTMRGDTCGIQRRAGPVKTIIDLSRLRLVDLFHEDVEGGPHRPLESVCGLYDAFVTPGYVALVIHHFLGRLDQWTYRVTDNRGAGYRLARFKDMNDYIGLWKSDHMRLWLQGFVESVGEKEASRLLVDVGKLQPLPGQLTSVSFNKRLEEDDTNTPKYEVGDIVLADWRNYGQWDWAHITAVFDGGFYNVMFIHDCSEDLGLGTERLKKAGRAYRTNLTYKELLAKGNPKAIVGYTDNVPAWGKAQLLAQQGAVDAEAAQDDEDDDISEEDEEVEETKEKEDEEESTDSEDGDDE